MERSKSKALKLKIVKHRALDNGFVTFSTGDIEVAGTYWMNLTLTPPAGVKLPDNPQTILTQLRDPSNQNKTAQYPDSYAVTVAEVVPDFMILKVVRTDQFRVNSGGAHIRIDFLIIP